MTLILDREDEKHGLVTYFATLSGHSQALNSFGLVGAEPRLCQNTGSSTNKACSTSTAAMSNPFLGPEHGPRSTWNHPAHSLWKERCISNMANEASRVGEFCLETAVGMWADTSSEMSIPSCRCGSCYCEFGHFVSSQLQSHRASVREESCERGVPASIFKLHIAYSMSTPL